MNILKKWVMILTAFINLVVLAQDKDVDKIYEKIDELSEQIYIQTEKRDYKKIVSLHEQMIELEQQVFEPRHLRIINSTMDLARSYERIKQYDKAISLYEEALKTQEALDPQSAYVAIYAEPLAFIYTYLKEHDKALPLYKKALEIIKLKHGEVTTATALAYDNLGLLYIEMKEYDQALLMFEKSLVINKELYGNDSATAELSQIYINMVKRLQK